MSKHKHRDQRKQPDTHEAEAPVVDKLVDQPATPIVEPPTMPMLPLYPVF